MGIIGWIVVGFIAGALAQRVTGAQKRGCVATIVVGVIGGLIGGGLFNAATGTKHMTDFGLGSIFVAFIGACVLLLVLQLVTGSGRNKRRR